MISHYVLQQKQVYCKYIYHIKHKSQKIVVVWLYACVVDKNFIRSIQLLKSHPPNTIGLTGNSASMGCNRANFKVL